MKKLFRGDKDFIQGWQSCVSGSTSGVIAAFCTNPIDVIKTNILASENGQYKGFFDCGRKLYKNSGFKVFLKGV